MCIRDRVDTVLMVIMALAIATPLGIFAAVYLVEYASRGNRLVSLVPVSYTHLDVYKRQVHTYPEYHPDNAIATFRVDIDVSTCGKISPLNTLDYLIGSFDSDIITMDYRVRGFTRDLDGKKLFIDHDITSIQDYIDDMTLKKYDAIDVNVYQSNIFHTKMLIKEIDLQNYLFNMDVYEIKPKTRLEIEDNLRREMIEIFSGVNIY